MSRFHKNDFDAMSRNVVFPWPSDTANVADSLLYRATHPTATYFAARPLFTSVTDISSTHAGQLAAHERSKYLTESVLYRRSAQYMYTKSQLGCLENSLEPQCTNSNTQDVGKTNLLRQSNFEK